MSDSHIFELSPVSLTAQKKSGYTTSKTSLQLNMDLEEKMISADKYTSPDKKRMNFKVQQTLHPNKYPRQVETNTKVQTEMFCSSDDECPSLPVVTDLGNFVFEWTRNVPIQPYKEIHTPYINASLQWSRVPRYATANGWDTENKHTDIIVQQITATPQRKGHGTKFLLDLADIAKDYKRGVQLQQTITTASMELSRKLQEKHGWYTSPFDKFSVFSPHSISVCKPQKDPRV